MLLDQPLLLDDMGRLVDDAGWRVIAISLFLAARRPDRSGQERAGSEKARREGAARGRVDHERSPGAASERHTCRLVIERRSGLLTKMVMH